MPRQHRSLRKRPNAIINDDLWPLAYFISMALLGKKNAVFELMQTESGASYRNFIMVYDAGLALTWAVPSYETVTSRASWCGLQAMPVILAV